MATASPVLLILGAGAGIGAHVAAQFARNGYKVALASRSAAPDPAYFTVQADFSDPTSVQSVFDAVKGKLGVPSVVVYNAAAYHINPDPFALPLAAFVASLHVNTSSVYAAAQAAVLGFAQLPAGGGPKTFILTGNALNLKPMPAALDLGVGKAGGAHIVEAAAMMYGERGFHFYFADERAPDGAAVGRVVSGEAAAKFYYELAGHKEQGPWDATFVKGKGYVEFDGRNVL